MRAPRSPRRTRRGARRLAVAAVLAVLAVLVAPLAAIADISVTIAVTVSRAPGLDAQGVLVSAFRHEDDRWQAYDSVSSPFDGDSAQVTLEVPAGGEYRVCAQDPANAYVMTCYGGGISPDDEESQTVSLVNGHGSVTLELRAPTFIGGKVTDDQGAPIADATVSIIREGDGSPASVSTDELGEYQVPVNEGAYLVAFDAVGHVSEYYDDAIDAETAEPVTATEETPAEGIDAQLDRLATISGAVSTAGLTEDEADQLAVVALDGDDEVARDPDVADGDYTLSDLMAGDYRVCVAESSAAVLTCLPTPVTVAPPDQLTGFDLTPTLKGRVVGTVTGPGGPIAGVTVTAFGEAGEGWEPVGSVTTGTGGGYALRLAAGAYKIRFSGGGHQREFYDDVPTLGEADELAVTDEHDTTADAELVPGGTISGSISGPVDEELDGIRIVAYAGSPGGWQEVADTTDLSGGSYAVEGLPVGVYRICAVVSGADWRPGCVGGLTPDSADPISIAGTETVTGRNLTLQPTVSSVVLSDLSVQGTPVVGQTLTVSATKSPSNAVVTWTWKRDGTTPAGTGTSYVVKPADVGHTLVVEGVATAAPRQPWQGVAGVAGPVTKAVFAATPSPTISGATGPAAAPRVGDTLQAVTGAWSPAPDGFAYQWLVDGDEAGSGATYQVRPEDQGSQIRVRVLGARDGYEDVDWLESPLTDSVLAPPVLQMTTPAGIAGAAVVGGRLTATAPIWAPVDVTSSYEWRLGGKVLGAGPSLDVPVAAYGATVQLVVTGSRAGSTSVTLGPVASAKVGAGRIALRSPAAIKGKAKAGKKLTYVAERTSPVAATRSFQWLRNGKPIKKATKPAYKLTKKDKGKRISLKVTLGAAGYQPLVSTTAAVKVKK